MHCFLRGAPLSAHSNCGGKAFQCIPQRRRRKPNKKKTPNAQRRISNPEGERTNVCEQTVSSFLNSTLGVGRWAFLNSRAFSLAQSKTRRLVCRTLCDLFFAEPGSCLLPVP